MRVNSYQDCWVEYTPRALNNRGLQQPMTCEVRPYTGAEWHAHKVANLQRMSNDLGEAERVTTQTLIERVRNIRNMTVVVHTADGETERPVRTGADFVAYAPDELQIDVLDAINKASTMQEGLGKKSK